MQGSIDALTLYSHVNNGLMDNDTAIIWSNYT